MIVTFVIICNEEYLSVFVVNTHTHIQVNDEFFDTCFDLKKKEPFASLYAYPI